MAGNDISILFVDAYDSFTQNIIALIHQQLTASITVISIDTDIKTQYGLSLDGFLAGFDAVVLGPGPGDPHNGADTGLFMSIIESASRQSTPILGICLGFQVLCLYFGLRVERLPMPCHGHVKNVISTLQNLDGSWITHLFDSVDCDDIRATCYNSLGIRMKHDLETPDVSRPGSSSASSEFSVAASSAESAQLGGYRKEASHLKVIGHDQAGYAMIVAHDMLPFWGVQFHPESCKSNAPCRLLLQNWLKEIQKTRQTVGEAAISTQSRTLAQPAKQQPKYCATKSGLTENEIYETLIYATGSSTGLVRWRTVPVQCAREDISGFVKNACQGSEVAMLESTKKGRFSIYAITPSQAQRPVHPLSKSSDPSAPVVLSFNGSVVSIKTGKHSSSVARSVTSSRDTLMKALERVMISKRASQGSQDIPFWGGFIGYFSYENGLEQLGLSISRCDEAINDIELVWVERSLVYDALTSTVYIQTIRKYDDIFLETMVSTLLKIPRRLPQKKTPVSEVTENSPVGSAPRAQECYPIYSLPDQNKYGEQFEKCQAALRAGDSYELCLTTEAQVTFSISQTRRERHTWQLYQNLQTHNPVPFAAYLDFLSVTILSSSPEQYMSWTREGIIDMIPMKGTVKRTPEMTLDRATTILSSPKEQAENLMIADLIRHDLYNTVGATSTVEVVKLCEVVEHETVYQLVSHIRAHPPIIPHPTPDSTQQHSIHLGFNALRTTLPPGSMTGAPKKRSCEILQSLEQRDRGVYSGILGYFDVGGGGCWCVCIRTAFRHKTPQASTPQAPDGEEKSYTETWRIGAGGAITVLSDKQAEWDEMNTKLNSVLKGFRIN